MKLSPLVGIVGHRQVGKTTFLEQHCDKYYVVDTDSEMKEVRRDPRAYIQSRAGTRVALDECQVVPELFPELKEWVRKHKRPGQFVLSGSVRFTSREAIRESLTGRMVNLELLPLTISEIEEEPLSDFLLRFLESDQLERWVQNEKFSEKKVQAFHKKMPEYFVKGGLPGLCFLRDEKQRAFKVQEQLLTLLDRDLRLVKKIQSPYSSIRSLVEALAELQGLPLDYTELQRRTQISTPTIKKLVDALEGIFLIRKVSIEGSTQGAVVFFEDHCEHGVLRRSPLSLGEQLTHLCFTHLRAQYMYRAGVLVRYFQYRTRGGAYLPLVYEQGSRFVGILPLVSPDEMTRHSGSIKSFLSSYARAKVLVLHQDHKVPFRAESSRVLMAPYGAVL